MPPIRPGSWTSAPDAAPANPCTKDIRMLGYDWPRFHAAVNDLPAALLFTTVLFDVAAGLTKRASLQAAALWTLWAGVVGGGGAVLARLQAEKGIEDRKSTRLNSSHLVISYAVFCLKKKKKIRRKA